MRLIVRKRNNDTTEAKCSAEIFILTEKLLLPWKSFQQKGSKQLLFLVPLWTDAAYPKHLRGDVILPKNA